MPGLMIHALLADKLCKKLNMTETKMREFMCGSLLPDTSGMRRLDRSPENEGKAKDKMIDDKYHDDPEDEREEGKSPKSNMTSHIGGGRDSVGFMTPDITEFEVRCKERDNMVLWGYFFHLYIDKEFFEKLRPKYFKVDGTIDDTKTPAGKEKLPVSKFREIDGDYNNVDAILEREHPEVFENISNMKNNFNEFLENLNKEFTYRLERAKSKKIEDMKILDMNDLSEFFDNVVNSFIEAYGKDIKPKKDREYKGKDR